MAKEKKTPKTNSDLKILSSDAEAILYGLILTMIAIIGLLNRGWVGEFLTYITVYSFGVFYSLFFLLIIFFGLHLIVKKNFYRLKVNLYLLGAILLIFSSTIAASKGIEGLNVTNAFTLFNQRMGYLSSSSFHIDSMDAIASSGGGLIGFFLCGLLNSCISPLGTEIIVYILFITGFILLFKGLFIRAYKWWKNFINKRKERLALADNNNSNKQIVLKNEQTIGNNNETTPSTPQFVTSSTAPLQGKELLKEVAFEEKVVSTPYEKKDYFVNEEETNATKVQPFFFDEKDDKETNFDEARMPFEENFKEDSTPTFETTVEKDNEQQPLVEEHASYREEVKPFFENPQIKSNQVTAPKFNESQNIESVKPTVEEKYRSYILPPLSLLHDHSDPDTSKINIEVANLRAAKINELFQEMKIGASVISYTIGPSVTRFDVKTNPGVRVASLSSLESEIAIKLSGNRTVRFEPIVEGMETSGIEVGNEKVSTVSFKECMQALSAYPNEKLLFPLGKDISGNVIKASIDDLPHMLVAGTTGSGKSVFINSLITSLVMRNRPDELKLLLIDPKFCEFAQYASIPHLLCPVITDAATGKAALKKLCEEMDRRYEMFAKNGRGATKYSEYVKVCKARNLPIPPVIVLVCDEYSDFMSEKNHEEVESLIQRIGQKARASGIHMILSTQRPSADVINPKIRSNLPSKIALSVTNATESRIIIQSNGAESLLGKGDMLANLQSYRSLKRIQSPFIDGPEIADVMEYIANQAKQEFDPNFMNLEEKVNTNNITESLYANVRVDPLTDQVRAYLIETQQVSTAKIENLFGIGYKRVDLILDTLEREGVVQKVSNNRRIVLIKKEETPEDEEN